MRERYAMIKIAPSILAADFSRLSDEIHRAEQAGADLLHIDVMDGHFVPNLTLGPFIVEAIKRVASIPLDVHLMIEEPHKFISRFASAGADIITFHLEVSSDPIALAEAIRKLKVRAGVSLSPPTPPEPYVEAVRRVDNVLVMTVNPGFGGQKFIEETLPKIRSLRRMLGPEADLQVDGGIDGDTVVKVASAGANSIVAGTYLFGSADMSAKVALLRKKARENFCP